MMTAFAGMCTGLVLRSLVQKWPNLILCPYEALVGGIATIRA
jgi:hypothetical protein